MSDRCPRGPLTLVVPLLLAFASFACGKAEGGTGGDEGGDTPAPVQPYDWLIDGGVVVDGTGAAPYAGDLLLRDGRIVHVGSVDPDTLEVVDRYDASGRFVAPGFIDLHAHGNPLGGAGFENFLAQGVTTLVLGQDGSSPPAGELGSRLAAIDRGGPTLNIAYMIGHNTLRGEAGAGHGRVGEDGLSRMTALVEEALDAGAFGLSLGLEYDPGRGADLRELVRLAEPVADRGGVVAAHLRSEDAGEVETAVAELLEQGARSGARVHVSHLKIVLGQDPAQADRILGMLERARMEGVPVTADVYPYTASFTGLSILFPDWARPPNDYARVVSERRSELADYLRARVQARNGPGATLFGTGPWAGRTLEEVAQEQDRPFEELLIELGPSGASAAYFVMDEGVMRAFLADPHVAVASDGSPTMRHPRGYGSFARVLATYVRDEAHLSLPEAIRKMTGLPASVLGLDDPVPGDPARGRIAPGWAADIAVFDLDRVVDHADFENPHRLADGMDALWVNGRLTWSEGGPVPGAGAGRALRFGGDGS